MLHKSEGTEPEEADTRASVGSPVSIEVHLDGLVEHAITTLDRLSVDALSEVTHLLGMVLHLVKWLSRVRLIKGKDPFRTGVLSHL